MVRDLKFHEPTCQRGRHRQGKKASRKASPGTTSTTFGRAIFGRPEFCPQPVRFATGEVAATVKATNPALPIVPLPKQQVSSKEIT